ncbi:hypothetical protein N9S22_03170 [Paracoccaceae bacterium]|jgi:hypothetical protein|nr:hypothetical protein [Paracoccaceae bacterium]
MQKFILMLTVIVGTATSTSAQYVDQNFSIKDLKVFVEIIDKAKEGCWTNISDTRKYIQNKLSESGISLIDDQSKTELTLKFSLVAKRTGHGWCYGNLSLNLTANVRLGEYMILGTFYQKNTVDIKSQHFNNSALKWLDKTLPELK